MWVLLALWASRIGASAPPVRGRCGASQRQAAGGCWSRWRLRGLRELARLAWKGLLLGGSRTHARALPTTLGPAAPRFFWKLAKRNSLFLQESTVWQFLSCLGQISTINVKFAWAIAKINLEEEVERGCILPSSYSDAKTGRLFPSLPYFFSAHCVFQAASPQAQALTLLSP